jgi:hypothetical protein
MFCAESVGVEGTDTRAQKAHSYPSTPVSAPNAPYFYPHSSIFIFLWNTHFAFVIFVGSTVNGIREGVRVVGSASDQNDC